MNDLIAAIDDVLRCWTHGDAAGMPAAMVRLQSARNTAHALIPVHGEDVRSTETIAQRERAV